MYSDYSESTPSHNYHIIVIVLPYIQNNVSETGFYLRLQVQPTQLGPSYRAGLFLVTG
jgi:hypothetical protein